MAKQLNVNLAFTADTSKAKAQLQDLQNQLSHVINMPGSSFAGGITNDIQQATQAAAELKVHLQNATNVKTGTLDFSKLNQSIKNSGSSLSEYAAKIQKIGPQGQKAFAMLAQSVASAEVPIRRSNALLSELWVTMKNTARWQLTSSMLHGFIGAVQSAVGYTQDLNESLNNIRIVTGNSVDQMADFAKEANKAAKALSTSTTNYTNAALIYYQQGLDEQQVKERTDITIKMANVSRQSAEEVSDQLTSIWNNFYDGSQSLEHFADVMTRLGADTASSSDEIAQGLEKFAAIGDMIGLSYDNAAAALATVTAQTRQSADVVGTAFKTIFARIQGLSLGETLEDGTTLNKYSNALMKVGISIKDQNGELKDMDVILSEMGAKWDTLSKDQQVALAQAVAGVRQYNQLVALMDNFDFYEQNLKAANNADGSLQEQADIYAESWEAASERVTAALEGLYDSLINDEAFIDVLNAVEKIITGVEKMVDSMGGFGGVITALGVIFTNVFRKQISQSITEASYSLKSWTEKGRESIRQEKKEEIEKILKAQGPVDENSPQGVQNTVIRAQLESQQKLIDSAKDLTDIEQRTLQVLLDQQKVRGELAIKAAEQEQAAKKAEQKARGRLYGGQQRFTEHDNDKLNAVRAAAERVGIAQSTIKAKDIRIDKMNEYAAGSEERQAIEELIAAQGALTTAKQNALKGHEKQTKAVEEYADSVITAKEAEQERIQAVDEATKEVKLKTDADEKSANATKKSGEAERKAASDTEKNTEEKKENTEASRQQAQQEDQTGQKVDEATQDIKENTAALEENSQKRNKLNSSQMAQNFVAGANAAMSAASAIQSVSSMMDTLESEAEPMDKLVSVVMSLSMAFMMSGNALKGLNKITLASGQSLGQAAAGSKAATAVFSKFGGALGKVGITAGTTGGALLALAGYAAVAVAAIVAVVKIVQELIDLWKDDERAVNGAREATKQATEAFNEAKNSLDSLSDSIAEYDKLQHAFDGLTEGTKEWNEALKASNAYVSEMLRQYPELAKYLENDGGRLSFGDRNNLDLVKEAYENKVIKANQALNTAQIAQNFAENRNARTQALRSKDYADVYDGGDFANTVAKYVGAGMTAGAAIGFKTGAAAGTLAGPVGTGIGGGAGVAAGATTGALIGTAVGLTAAIGNNITASQESEKALDRLQDAYDTQGSLVFTSYDAFSSALEGISQETIDALWENSEKLEKLAIETNLNTLQMRALIESNVANVLAGNQYYEGLDTEDKDLAGTVVADRAAKALADPDSEEYKEARQRASTTIFNGALGKDNYDEYLKARFGDDWQNYRVVNTAGNDATLQRKNENGTWDRVGDKNTLSNTEVLDFMTSHYLQQMTGEDQEEIKSLQNLETFIKDAGTLIGDSEEDEKKILQLQKDLVTDGVTSLVNFSPSEVKQIEEAMNAKGDLIASEYATAIRAAIEDYDPAEYANRVIAQEREKMQGIFAEAAQELDMSDEVFESYAASLMEADGKLKEFNEIQGETAEETAELRAEQAKLMTAYAKASTAQYRLAKGLNKVQKAYKDNIDILEEADEASLDFHEAVGELSEALSDAFNMEVDASFVKDNLGLIKAAANGSEEALIQLRAQLNKDFIMSLGLESENAETALISELERLSNLALNADIVTELKLENADAITALNEALYTGKATIQDIEAMFNNANLAMPEYKTTEVPGEVAKSHSVVKGKFMGIPYTMESDMETTTMRTIPYFGDNPPTVGEGGKVDYGGGGTLTTTTTGDIDQLDKIVDYEGDDGKKSGGKEYKPEIDRYHEINKEIEKQEKALKRLSKAKADAFGASKLSAIDAEIQGIKNLKAANEELYRQQQEKLNEDAGALMALFPEADISNGYIANYNDLLMKTTTEDQKKILDQYEQTWSAVNDTYYKLLDFDDQVKDLNYEKLSYTVELNIDLNDSELQMLELKLKSYEDNFYKMSETAAIMRDQGKLYEEALGHYENGWKSYQSAYEAGDITQEKYIDGLKNARDGMYSQLEALVDLDKEMMHFYEDTLASAQEEMEGFTDHMEHLTGVFDHYLNLMDILGKSKDYEAMDDFLMGRADTIRDRLDTAKSYYDMLLEQKAQVEQKLNAAIASGDDAAAELYKEEWDAIVTATDEAQEEVLSLTEEWAEAMKEAIEKKMEKITDTLEKALTKGLGFENLMDNFDKLNTQQEEFLTKTNQIYETNKMMRAANKALDETDNKVAKQKLKNFISETQNLQENNRLSKVELEIQQAKYDLLLAEIALEEAQNAKSTVRLSRDSEGNFGYVYTADENEVAEAEQAVDDADNNLYNLSLEKQQEYTEKYIQAQEQMFNELTQLHEDYMAGLITDEEFEIRRQTIEKYYLGSAEYNAALELLNEQYRNGQITSEEEYNAKKQALMEQYQGETGILTEYSNLYNIAVQGHAAATQENWQKEYSLMTQNTSDWKDAVDQYLLDIQEQTNNWKDVSVQANSDVKGALDNSKLATQQLTTESDKLKTKLLTEVIPALRTELTDVNNLTTAYGNERDAIQGVIQKYSEYIAIMNKAIQTAAQVPDNKGGGTKPPAPTPTTKPSTSTGSGTGGTTTGGKNNTTYTPPTYTAPAAKEPEPPKDPDPPFEQGDTVIIDKGNIGYKDPTKAGGLDDLWNKGVASKQLTVTINGTRTINGVNWYKYYDSISGRDWWMIGHNMRSASYDTGGYTGEWGPEGKLAMLHQKELVLNADDTENILASVNFVRDIMKSIDQQAAWASNGLGLLTASGYGNAGGGTLEQTVTIHAEFPNATNHSEIEEAFNNLVNRATQYANRK